VASGRESQHQDTFLPDFDFRRALLQDPKEGDEVFGLKLIGSKKNISYANDELLIYLVLRKVLAGHTSASVGKVPTFERIGLLTSQDEIQFDGGCEAGAVEQLAVVRIV